MRSCEEFEDLASAMVDGMLEETERTLLIEHMARCPQCQVYFEDLMAIHNGADRQLAKAPEDFWNGVMDSVQRTSQENPGRKVIRLRNWRRWTTLAACCAVVVLGARGLLRSDKKDMASTPAAYQAEAGVTPRCAKSGETEAFDSGIMPEAALAEAENQMLNGVPAGSMGTGTEKAQPVFFAGLPERLESLDQSIELYLGADGSFSLCGSDGGQLSGSFAGPEQIDAFTYSLKVEAITLEEPASGDIPQWEVGTEFLLCLPGADAESLPDAFAPWTDQNGLSGFGLYCQEKEIYFIGIKD